MDLGQVCSGTLKDMGKVKGVVSKEDYIKVLDTMPILCVDAIVIDKGRCLLVKRKNEPLKGQYWLPGGRVFKNETLEDAVKRKMKEEIGVEVSIIKLAGFHEYLYKENEFGLDSIHTLSAVFFVSPLDTMIVIDSQSDDYIWSDTLPEHLKLIV